MNRFAVLSFALLLVIVSAVSAPAQPENTPATVQTSQPGKDAGIWKPLVIADFGGGDDLDERDTWMPTAIAESLAWRLRRAPNLTVIPTIRAHQSRREMAEKASELPAWSRVVEMTGAKLWLRGKCGGTPYKATMTLELVRVGSENEKPAQVEIGPGRLFEIIDDATCWVLGELGVTRIDQVTDKLIFAPPAKSSTALEYYAKALMAARQENMRDGSYFAMRAVDADPGNTAALMLLAKVEMRSTGRAWQRADVHLRQVKILSDDRDDRVSLMDFEIAQGLLLMMDRSFEPARHRFEVALKSAQERNDPYGQLTAMNCLCDYWLNVPPTTSEKQTPEALTAQKEQNLRHAVEWENGVLALLADLGDHVALAPGYNKLALLHEQLMEPELALRAYQKTIESAKKIGSKRTEATGSLFLGQWYRRQERLPEALEMIQRCLELVPDQAKPAIHLSLGELHRDMSRESEALGHYEKAYAALVDSDDLVSQFTCLHAIAELRMKMGEREVAIKKLSEALDIAQVLEMTEEESIRTQLAQWKGQKP